MRARYHSARGRGPALEKRVDEGSDHRSLPQHENGTEDNKEHGKRDKPKLLADAQIGEEFLQE
jgi:hypothetical protein